MKKKDKYGTQLRGVCYDRRCSLGRGTIPLWEKMGDTMLAYVYMRHESCALNHEFISSRIMYRIDVAPKTRIGGVHNEDVWSR